jgi:hypothetical protein
MTFGKKWFSFFWKFFLGLLLFSFISELVGYPVRQSPAGAVVPGWVRWSFDYAFGIALTFAAIERGLRFIGDFGQALADEIVERVIDGLMKRLYERDRARAELYGLSRK